MKPVLWALAALLAIASLMDRTGGTVEPATGGEAAALAMRDAICERISFLAEEHAGQVEDGEFQSEAADCKAFADQAGPIIKEVTEKLSKDVAGMYANARELPNDKQPKAKAAVWYGIAKGMKR